MCLEVHKANNKVPQAVKRAPRSLLPLPLQLDLNPTRVTNLAMSGYEGEFDPNPINP